MGNTVTNTEPGSVGKGRPPKRGGNRKGIPNKATASARQAIAMLAEGAVVEMQTWLRATAYGVGTPYVRWDASNAEVNDDGEPQLPTGAKIKGPAKRPIIFVPLLDDAGNPRVVTLADVMGGTMPQCDFVDWLVQPDPDAANNTLLRALEYHIPKLGRVEHVDPEGNAAKLPTVIEYRIIDARPKVEE